MSTRQEQLLQLLIRVLGHPVWAGDYGTGLQGVLGRLGCFVLLKAIVREAGPADCMGMMVLSEPITLQQQGVHIEALAPLHTSSPL